MNVYCFQATLWCEDCGKHLCDLLPKPRGYDPGNEHTWASDAYPKGPYCDGGGEADCPQHCDGCSVFLENPLTLDGDDYVRQALQVYSGAPGVLAVWREFYDYLS